MGTSSFISLPLPAAQVLGQLEQAGYESWAVGGFVRDALGNAASMQTTPGDIDIATSALPAEVKEVFHGHTVVDTGIAHGTVTLVYEGKPYEITTFRADGPYTDGRRPDNVTFSKSIEADLARRDFTVNAITYSPSRGLFDPFGGQKDLAARRLRCVGDAVSRFQEDGLRVLRGLRFMSQLGLVAEEKTERAMHSEKDRLAAVSGERLFIELKKLLCGNDVKRVLLSYPDVLGVFLPEILPMVGFDQKNPHHIWDVWTHTAIMVQHTPLNSVDRLISLFHDSGKPKTFTVDSRGRGHFYDHGEHSTTLTEGVLLRLRASREETERILKGVRHHDDMPPSTRQGVHRLLSRLGEERFVSAMVLKRADNLAQNPAHWNRLANIDAALTMARQLVAERPPFSLRDLAVKGRDLQGLGVAPGPIIGETLAFLFEKVIQQEKPNEKEALLESARVFLQRKQGASLPHETANGKETEK